MVSAAGLVFSFSFTVVGGPSGIYFLPSIDLASLCIGLLLFALAMRIAEKV
jgi:hypothetical protein